MTATTLHDACISRLRDIQTARRNAERKHEREAATVLAAFRAAVLDGIEMGDAEIGAHHVGSGCYAITVRFPTGERVGSVGEFGATPPDQRFDTAAWFAERTDESEKAGLRFLDAVMWALDIKLDERPDQPEPPAKSAEPAIPALLIVAATACLQNQDHVHGELWGILDRFRCACGEFPVEGSTHGYWCVRCCTYEWDCWEDFLAWKENQS